MEDKNSSRMWVYPPNYRTKVGARWSPSFPRQSLARRRAQNIVQVHAHALNGSWECYHVVRIGLGAIWGDHGRRRSLHFTTPHFVLKSSGYTHFVHFPNLNCRRLEMATYSGIYFFTRGCIQTPTYVEVLPSFAQCRWMNTNTALRKYARPARIHYSNKVLYTMFRTAHRLCSDVFFCLLAAILSQILNSLHCG